MYFLSQGKTDRPSRLELGRQQQQQQTDDGLLGPAPGGGFNPLLFLQNAHSRGPAMSKFFFAGFFTAAAFLRGRYKYFIQSPGRYLLLLMFISVADPDPNIFGPPGSGSSSQEVRIWIRILLSSKNSKKNLHFMVFFYFYL
jgi:hypothetical protein